MPVVFNDAKLLELRAALHDAAVDVVSSTAFQIEAEAKVHAPRDPARPPQDLKQKVTGALRGSIQTHMEKPLRWQVYVGVMYGAFQEFGTRYIPARPYLGPAVEKYKQQFYDRIKALVK